jgi:hypothetical protein
MGRDTVRIRKIGMHRTFHSGRPFLTTRRRQLSTIKMNVTAVGTGEG